MLFQYIMEPNSFLTQSLLHVSDDLLFFPRASAVRRSLTTSFGAVFLFASETRGMSPLCVCVCASMVSSASSGAEVVVATLNTSDLELYDKLLHVINISFPS